MPWRGGGYMESGSSHPPPETTPSDRVRSEQQALKKRVEVVDPNESRCVILNNDDITDVKYTRYFNGQFMDDEMMMRNLEWWWNMRLSSLSLDTRDNVIPLSASMAKLLEHNSWLLLPALKIVQRYHKKTKRVEVKGVGPTTIGNRNGFPIVERGVFEYDFIPLGSGMKKRVIHRQVNFKEFPTGEDFQVHLHPFPNLCGLKSNLHPKFALLEAGRQVNNMLTKAFDQGGLESLMEVNQDLERLDERLIMAGDIARAWMAPHHGIAMQDVTFNPPPGEHIDDGYQSDVTGPRQRKELPGDEESVDEDGNPKTNVTPPFRPSGNSEQGAGDRSYPVGKGKGKRKRA